MRRIIYFSPLIATVLMAGLLATPKENKQVTGAIANGVYTDNRFGFSLKLPVDWKEGKFRKDPSSERLIVSEKRPRVPIKLQDSPDQALKPTIMVFADTCNLKPEEFFAFLGRDTVKSDFKEAILRKSVLLDPSSVEHMEILDRTKALVAGRNALKLKARREYSVQIPPPSSVGTTPILVRDFRSGFIYIVPFDGWLMYIEEVAENQFLPSLTDEFDAVAKSITLAVKTDSTAATPTEGNK